MRKVFNINNVVSLRGGAQLRRGNPALPLFWIATSGRLAFLAMTFVYTFLLLYTSPVQARPLVADAFPRKINIDHNFKGLSVLVYGARNDAGNVVIVVRGPKKDLTLLKKGKVAGIWTNVKRRNIEDINSFYAVASMNNLQNFEEVPNSINKALQIGLENLGYNILNGAKSDSIRQEINQIMKDKNLFSKQNYEISFWGETLFRTFINFPKNITRGTYNIDIYLFNDGILTSYQTLPIIVEQVGFEAFMYDFAQTKPTIYGIVAVAIALFMGWFASVLFLRRHD